jgi:hypothetical protein
MSLIHMIMLNTCLRDPKSGWNSNSRFKFEVSNFCKVWTIKLSHIFLELIGMELGHTPKIEIVPNVMFYKFANLHKI